MLRAGQEARTLLATVGELKEEALGAALQDWQVKAPDTGNDISPVPFAFNLMFRTSIGPSGDVVGFLRPETAQGIFVNFKCAPSRHRSALVRCLGSSLFSADMIQQDSLPVSLRPPRAASPFYATPTEFYGSSCKCAPSHHTSR